MAPTALSFRAGNYVRLHLVMPQINGASIVIWPMIWGLHPCRAPAVVCLEPRAVSLNMASAFVTPNFGNTELAYHGRCFGITVIDLHIGEHAPGSW